MLVGWLLYAVLYIVHSIVALIWWGGCFAVNMWGWVYDGYLVGCCIGWLLVFCVGCCLIGAVWLHLGWLGVWRYCVFVLCWFMCVVICTMR